MLHFQRMEAGLLVLKEETVATSLAGLVCDPSAFIVEEYSEEVVCTRSTGAAIFVRIP